MAETEDPLVSLFKKRATAVTAKVVEVKDLREAMSYALEVCEKKDFCEQVYVGDNVKLGSYGKAAQKMLAAPGLSKQNFAMLEKNGKEKGFTVIRGGLRAHVSGIDVGFSTAEMGIASTGTCVLTLNNEDMRLTTMICEAHVVALPKSRLVNDLEDAENFLNKIMNKGVMYTSFISGPSRTADIERVLVIGVHGPLEMHVALMES
ncbi:MAG: lactate utilization protein [Deltaproteobacteria bacterium]|jgi:L-lactate dehydrogenase complex protein LldG|nr:lactate utilization protein [Deltaproteobacteria bacterium]